MFPSNKYKWCILKEILKKKKEIMQNIWETNEKQHRYNPQEVMKVQR